MSHINVLNDLRSYSRHWLTEFIETYRSEECLWQSKHPEYSNHAVRNKAYDKLVEKLKEVEPNPDRAMVVRKINSLRSAFRREFRKTSSKSNYETRLWYFDKLLFIADQNPKRLCGGPKRELKLNFEDDTMEYDPDDETAKNEQICPEVVGDVAGNPIKTEGSNGNVGQGQQQTTAVKVLEITTLDSNSQREIQQAVNSLEQHQQQMQQHMQNAQAQQTQVTQIHHQQVPTIQISREHLPTLFNSATYESPRHNDEFDAIGVNVASKLRVMNPTQRIIAEKLISDVLFNGQLDNLNVSSTLSQ